MIDTRAWPYRLILLLFLGVLIFSAGGCAGLPLTPATPADAPIATGGSVQDQLAQLAAGAQPHETATTAAPEIRPTATPTPGMAAAATRVEPTATRTRRATATRKATATVRPTRPPTATPALHATRTPRPTRTPSDGLPTVALAKLPPEARETIRLIQQGGPFPYKRDGVTFENREGRLPKHRSGYYKEYTVVTPGSADRGARRVIAGEGGELYYTGDHYDTFKRVLLP